MKEQADFQSTDAQVVEKLTLGDRRRKRSGFQLDRDLVIDQQVEPTFDQLLRGRL